MSGLAWASPQTAYDVVRHPFTLATATGEVPGIAWLAEPASGLVMLGHGGRGHKANDRTVRLAERLVLEHGLSAVALDGPFHGDRAPATGLDYQALTVAAGVETIDERTAEEWVLLLDHLGGHGPVGYLGLSMGCRVGLRVAARLGHLLDAAVLGKMGVRDSGVLHRGLVVPEQVRATARDVRAPVLFHLEEHDEVFPAAAQRELFAALGSSEKVLRVRSGQHGSSRPEDETAWLDFLAARFSTVRSRPSCPHAR